MCTTQIKKIRTEPKRFDFFVIKKTFPESSNEGFMKLEKDVSNVNEALTWGTEAYNTTKN